MVTLDNRKNIRSFGRLNGRAIGLGSRFLLTNELASYSLNLEKLPSRNEINYLEIGFGYGESLVSRASEDNSANHIGCEVYSRGIINLLKLILTNNIKNIRIFDGDARVLLEKIEDSYFNGLFILFPDPWPKKRQHKKRIINEAFMELAIKKLKPGGKLFFASDSEDYAELVLKLMRNNSIAETPLPASLAECRGTPGWWVETRYQQKARESGRSSFFIEYSVLPRGDCSI
ncbi:MAG: tRNA (guanosine(46)-N7)-methyltransferase TrmB [Rickettsiales bacterium]|jgi:tRNA (guanine-N(7)-)-methyltransferase|nr:tRNA (guanosine(46)-N7)-methyltransferase TrmB [Rickettsiales bacterium]